LLAPPPCSLARYSRVAGRYPEFIEHFHKLLARSQNALRGRCENFWASEQTCVVKLVGREAVLDKLIYTATNPVLSHLVERVHHWPGVNGFSALGAAPKPASPGRDAEHRRKRCGRPRRASHWHAGPGILRTNLVRVFSRPVVFPPGTYSLQRFASVPIVDP
jgi:hypothetical protein